MHRSDCILPFAFRRGTRPLKAVTALLLCFPLLVVLLLVLDRHREEKQAAKASLRRARAALGSGALAAWPCALLDNVPRKMTLGDLLQQLGNDGRCKIEQGKKEKNKKPQQVLAYHRRRLWTPAPPPPAVQQSLLAKIKSFVLSLGQKGQQKQKQQQHKQAAGANSTQEPEGTGAPSSSIRQTTNGTTAGMSSLGAIIDTLWNVKRQHGGIIKATLEGERHKQSLARKHGDWAVEMMFNPGRAAKPINLPDADAVLPVRVPRDPTGFGFTQAAALDLLFLYTPPDIVGEEEVQERQRALEANTPAAALSNASHPLRCGCGPASASQQHAVLVNPYPIGALSGIIAPFVREGRPQDMFGAEEALQVALGFAADASRARAGRSGAAGAGAGGAQGGGEQQEPRRTGIRVGYNSMSACASVNHLHFQFWRFDASPDGLLPLERAAQTKEQGDRGGNDSGVEVFRVQGHPVRAFALRAPTLAALARGGSRCLDALLRRDVPHSLLMDGEQLFVVPRQKFAKPLPFAVSPGFPEASGLLLVMSQEDFEDENRLNADLVWDLWEQEMSLSGEQFEEVLHACVDSMWRP